VEPVVGTEWEAELVTAAA
jgi:prefoldin subunit 5